MFQSHLCPSKEASQAEDMTAAVRHGKLSSGRHPQADRTSLRLLCVAPIRGWPLAIYTKTEDDIRSHAVNRHTWQRAKTYRFQLQSCPAPGCHNHRYYKQEGELSTAINNFNQAFAIIGDEPIQNQFLFYFLEPFRGRLAGVFRIIALLHITQKIFPKKAIFFCKKKNSWTHQPILFRYSTQIDLAINHLDNFGGKSCHVAKD